MAILQLPRLKYLCMNIRLNMWSVHFLTNVFFFTSSNLWSLSMQYLLSFFNTEKLLMLQSKKPSGYNIWGLWTFCIEVQINQFFLLFWPKGAEWLTDRHQYNTNVNSAILLTWLNHQDQQISKCIFSQRICSVPWNKTQSYGLERKYLVWILSGKPNKRPRV